MPAYNHARFVGFAIESILAQTFADFELLITDDCSPDITYEVIRSYDDPRIKAVRPELRSGPSVTINASMRRARGKYIGFCASDDMWLPEKLERQVPYLKTHPDVAALFSKAWFIDADGTRLPDSAHGQLASGFGGENFDRRQWLAWLFRNGNCLCAATPLLRADAVRTIGEFNPLMLQLQDYDYWVRLLGGHELWLSTERLVEYRVDSDGANISKGSMAAYARTTYESYRVLCHFADGYAADALAATPLMGEPLFTWQPAATCCWRSTRSSARAPRPSPRRTFCSQWIACTATAVAKAHLSALRAKPACSHCPCSKSPVRRSRKTSCSAYRRPFERKRRLSPCSANWMRCAPVVTRPQKIPRPRRTCRSNRPPARWRALRARWACARSPSRAALTQWASWARSDPHWAAGRRRRRAQKRC